MIRLSGLIRHIHRRQINLHAGDAKVEGYTDKFVDLFFVGVNPGDSAVVLNANTKATSVSTVYRRKWKIRFRGSS